MKIKGTFPRLALGFALSALLSAALGVNTPAQEGHSTGAPQQTGQGMGVSTGSSVVTGTRRTAGIVDPKAPVVFEDVTAKTALAQFRNRSGSPQKDYIVETVTGGVALFDYDNDGLLDIYIVNGSTIAAEKEGEAAARGALP